jgi:hypothetical protein
MESALRPPLPIATRALADIQIQARLTNGSGQNIIASIRGSRRQAADIKSESRPASNRNRWPPSYCNAWPASSESASSRPASFPKARAWPQVKVKQSKGGQRHPTIRRGTGEAAMLTSATVQGGQVAARGYGSKSAADKTGPAPLAPQLAQRKGHHGPARVLSSAPGYELAGLLAREHTGEPPWIGRDRSRTIPYEPGHDEGSVQGGPPNGPPTPNAIRAKSRQKSRSRQSLVPARERFDRGVRLPISRRR